MTLGKRIMIIGSGGAGKSTLARQLGEILGLPVIHLDRHFWRPGWVETPRDEWPATVDRLASGARWIIDGNYGGTISRRIAVAQTIIFLDLPAPLCLWRVLKRRVRYHGKTRPDLTPGCPEKIDLEFIKWVCYDYPSKNRPRLLALLDDCRDEKQVIELRSPRAVRRFLAEVVNG